MGPSLSSFMKCVSFAVANHHSGEFAALDMTRAIGKDDLKNPKPWDLMAEYEVKGTNGMWRALTQSWRTYNISLKNIVPPF